MQAHPEDVGACWEDYKHWPRAKPCLPSPSYRKEGREIANPDLVGTPPPHPCQEWFLGQNNACHCVCRVLGWELHLKIINFSNPLSMTTSEHLHQ